MQLEMLPLVFFQENQAIVRLLDGGSWNKIFPLSHPSAAVLISPQDVAAAQCRCQTTEAQEWAWYPLVFFYLAPWDSLSFVWSSSRMLFCS